MEEKIALEKRLGDMLQEMRAHKRSGNGLTTSGYDVSTQTDGKSNIT